jgi:SAM-dependent methyltransferase
MGLTRSDCKLLFYCREQGISFESVLTLGRLTRYFSKHDVEQLSLKFLGRMEPHGNFDGDFSDELFKFLGAKNYVSSDNSNYEGATLIHDFNLPIPLEHTNKYTIVLDSGTIEHIFNFPQAIKNCMQALRVGGYYIGITPANNLMGHGFYQFSPELYYRIFSEQFGFRVKHMFVAPLNSEDNWYAVSDPAVVKDRVVLCNNQPLTLMIVAEKTAEVNLFEHYPMQSDYVQVWKAKHLTSTNQGPIRRIAEIVLPQRVKMFLIKVLDLFRKKSVEDSYLGSINPDHFKKVNI